MAPHLEIRADFDRSSIVVYQAYNDSIADAALVRGRFAPPFSFGRMTWIKPSFLWMMERSNWGRKASQERTLAVRISRTCWEEALALGVMTSPGSGPEPDTDAWRERFSRATVHLQWDPERSLRGAKLQNRSIQVGISRHLIRDYVDRWILSIEDLTPLVRKLHGLLQSGHHDQAARLLPVERPYPLSDALKRNLGITRGETARKS